VELPLGSWWYPTGERIQLGRMDKTLPQEVPSALGLTVASATALTAWNSNIASPQLTCLPTCS
jgi:hypothetical protein